VKKLGSGAFGEIFKGKEYGSYEDLKKEIDRFYF